MHEHGPGQQGRLDHGHPVQDGLLVATGAAARALAQATDVRDGHPQVHQGRDADRATHQLDQVLGHTRQKHGLEQDNRQEEILHVVTAPVAGALTTAGLQTRDPQQGQTIEQDINQGDNRLHLI